MLILKPINHKED